ncbi:hypothetical protein [Kitasatospora sp. NPDC002965]|uniref:hypothetical protein n=1 Tax=Kitasatospora sp. NPDC002965 TaxID=3154775 RepID=UPI00339FEEDC
MGRSSAFRLRPLAVALAASACLAAGTASAQAAPAGAEAVAGGAYANPDVLSEVRTFTGNGVGTSPSQAVDGAVRTARAVAQSAGWQASQCHVRATDVRSVGGGVYAAVASLFCQR